MRKYLVLDLEEDDRRFRSKLPEFWEKVSCANEKCKKMEGAARTAVESTSAEDPYCGKSASEPNQPSEPKEPKVSQPDDFLADLFNNPPKKTEPEKKPVNGTLEELFGDASSLLKKPVITVPPEVAIGSKPPVASAPKVVAEVIDQTESAFLVSIPGSVDDVERGTEPEESKPWGTDLADALSGFDEEGFKKIISNISRNIEGVDRSIDLKRAEKTLDEYKVSLDLDSSDRLGSLGDKMAQVQAQMDSIRLPLSKLTAWGNAIEKCWKYIESVGVLFSSASSREKRDAQVKLVFGDLWIEYATVTRVRDSYQEQLEALQVQWNTLSRLITHDMSVRNTIRGISAGELTDSEKAAIAEEVAKQISSISRPDIPEENLIATVARTSSPSSPKADQTGVPTVSASTIFDAEPSTDPLQFADLENFPKNATEVSKKKKTKGEVDWSDF
jgi:hypothetical protein